MATNGGPNTIEDGLVLSLDAVNGKSFRGEPTENLNADPLYSTRQSGDTISLSAWGGDTGYGEFLPNNSSVGGGLMFINHNTSEPAGSGGTYTDFPSTRFTLENGKTYTRTWYAKSNINQNISGHICSCNRDSDNTYIVGGSINVTPQWKRYTHTFTWNGTTSSNWQFRHINYKKSSVYIANVQLEEKPYPTRFVNGTRGTTVSTGGGWVDISGNNNHGEVINGVTTEDDGTAQGALEFDGTNQQITYPATNSPDHSVEIWFKANDLNSTQGLIGEGAYYRLYLANNTLYWWNREAGSGTSTSISYFSVDTNEWYHAVGVTKSGLERKLFLNGIEVSSENTNLNFDTGTTNGAIANRWPNSNSFFHGKIAGAKKYNRALTPQEVLQNYNATKSRFGL